MTKGIYSEEECPGYQGQLSWMVKTAMKMWTILLQKNEHRITGGSYSHADAGLERKVSSEKGVGNKFYQ